MKVKHNPNALPWRGIPMSSRDFSVSLTKSTLVQNPTVEFVTQSDVVVRRTTGTSSTTSYDVAVLQDLSLGPTQITNLTPSVMQLQGSSLVGQQYNSVGRIRVRGYAGTRDYTLQFPDQAPTVTEVDEDVVSGTLAAHCMTNLLARMSGKTPGGPAQNVFLESNHGFTLSNLSCSGYNPNSIVAGLDLACVQFASSRPAASPSQTSEHRVPSLLVGPRHMIAAYHAMNYPGDRVFFRRNDGSFAEAIVTAVRDLGDDLGLTVLDRDITGIQFARVLPQNWPTKLRAPYANSTVENGATIIKRRDRVFVAIGLTGNTSPGLGFVRHAQLFGLSQLGHLDNGVIFRSVAFAAPANPAFNGWYSQPYGGDSNSPMFVIIEQAGVQVPVFLTNFYTAFSGPSYGAHVNMINTNLNQMSVAAGDNRPFSLLTADLSAFPDVP